MTLNSIDVKHLTFKYTDQQDYNTLDDLSFHVKQGEWLSIIGHNGSGKSTTVRLIDGLLAAESGQIFVEGELLTEENVWNIRQKIGMVFQNPDNQFVGATVEDDVAFGLENKGIPLEEMKARVKEALKLVGMSAFANREPSRLSGGQKQRVAIAGALAMAPELLVLDEATSMLDPKGRKEVNELVGKLHLESKMTILSITHDIEEVSMSDFVIVMNEGKIVLQGTPQEILMKTSTLVDLALDVPFSVKFYNAMKKQGITLSTPYDIEGMVEELCQLNSKM